jgi:hypothetical protein
VDSPSLWVTTLAIFGIACLGKGVACWLAARLNGASQSEALGIGTLMNARGMMELILLNIGRERADPPTLFTILVLMTLATTLMATPLSASSTARPPRPSTTTPPRCAAPDPQMPVLVDAPGAAHGYARRSADRRARRAPRGDRGRGSPRRLRDGRRPPAPRHRSRACRGARRQPHRLLLAAARLPRRRGRAAADRRQRSAAEARLAARFEVSALVVPEAAKAPASTPCRRPATRPPRPSSTDRPDRRRHDRRRPVAMLKLTSGRRACRSRPSRPRRRSPPTGAPCRDHGHPAGRLADRRDPGVALSALGNIVAPLLLQGTAVVLRDAFVPTQILDDAVRVGARLFAGVPFMFDRLVALVRDGWPWPATLQTMISAGAPSIGPRRGPSPATPAADPLALRDERDGRHRLRHRSRSRRRGGDGAARAGRDAGVLAGRRRGAGPAGFT